MSFRSERSGFAQPVPEPFTEEPTRPLSVAGSSDHCGNCGAPLASDQRYCVNCGERRGKPRFTLAGPQAQVAQEVTVRTSPARRRLHPSAGFNLIAGVATLLLAMGVGVLIGHNNSSNSGRAPAAQVITVNGGASTTPSSGSAAASTASNSGVTHTSNSKHGGSAKHAAKAAPPKVVIQKAAAAASKVTGGSAKVAAPTATQGSSCTAGTAGCQNGKLTGNYFGQ
jgi:hypothetical protein